MSGVIGSVSALLAGVLAAIAGRVCRPSSGLAYGSGRVWPVRKTMHGRLRLTAVTVTTCAWLITAFPDMNAGSFREYLAMECS